MSPTALESCVYDVGRVARPSAPDPRSRPLKGYAGVEGHWDEAVFPDAAIRPPWQRLFQALGTQSVSELQGRHDLCRRILRESGVTYTPPDRELHEERPGSSTRGPC